MADEKEAKTEIQNNICPSERVDEIIYPYYACYTTFLSSSIPIKQDVLNILDKNYNNDLLFIPGGADEGQTLFKCYHCDCNTIPATNQINKQTNDTTLATSVNDNNSNTNNNQFTNLKSRNNDPNASKEIDLQEIGLNCGKKLLSFNIENHDTYGNCFVIINTDSSNGDTGLNVYLFGKNKWLFDENRFREIFNEKIFDAYWGCRSLLFDEQVLIVSLKKELIFYDLSKMFDNVRLLGIYTLQSQQRYAQHGMICLDAKYRKPKSKSKATKGKLGQNENENNKTDLENEDQNEKLYYKFKICLFGGIHSYPFKSSFTEIDIYFRDSLDNINDKNFDNLIRVSEGALEMMFEHDMIHAMGDIDIGKPSSPRKSSGMHLGQHLSMASMSISASKKLGCDNKICDMITQEDSFLFDFGFCTFKWNTKVYTAIIGGKYNRMVPVKSILLYDHMDTHLYIKPDILPIGCNCAHYPSIKAHEKVIHVVSEHCHFIIDIPNLMKSQSQSTMISMPLSLARIQSNSLIASKSNNNDKQKTKKQRKYNDETDSKDDNRLSRSEDSSGARAAVPVEALLSDGYDSSSLASQPESDPDTESDEASQNSMNSMVYTNYDNEFKQFNHRHSSMRIVTPSKLENDNKQNGKNDKNNNQPTSPRSIQSGTATGADSFQSSRISGTSSMLWGNGVVNDNTPTSVSTKRYSINISNANNGNNNMNMDVIEQDVKMEVKLNDDNEIFGINDEMDNLSAGNNKKLLKVDSKHRRYDTLDLRLLTWLTENKLDFMQDIMMEEEFTFDMVAHMSDNELDEILDELTIPNVEKDKLRNAVRVLHQHQKKTTKQKKEQAARISKKAQLQAEMDSNNQLQIANTMSSLESANSNQSTNSNDNHDSNHLRQESDSASLKQSTTSPLQTASAINEEDYDEDDDEALNDLLLKIFPSEFSEKSG